MLYPNYDFMFDFSGKKLAQLQFYVRLSRKKDILNLVVDIKSYIFEVDVRATLSELTQEITDFEVC